MMLIFPDLLFRYGPRLIPPLLHCSSLIQPAVSSSALHCDRWPRGGDGKALKFVGRGTRTTVHKTEWERQRASASRIGWSEENTSAFFSQYVSLSAIESYYLTPLPPRADPIIFHHSHILSVTPSIFLTSSSRRSLSHTFVFLSWWPLRFLLT